MNWEFNLLKKLGIAMLIASNFWSFSNLKTLAETDERSRADERRKRQFLQVGEPAQRTGLGMREVEVSGGGKCEGDITADNLNGKVVFTYSNGDRYE